MKKGFTLIELLVVIAIIGMLSGVVLAATNASRVKARDTRRKEDLFQIRTALELYYGKNNSYPSTNATFATDSSANHTDYSHFSTAGWGFLQGALSPTYIAAVPVDPINIDAGPWPWQTPLQNTIYTYSSNGNHYILCAWLENTSDAARLGNADVTDPFNTTLRLSADDGYSPYTYCLAQ